MALVVFAQTKPIYSLERGTLRDWPAATIKRRAIAIRLLTASTNDTTRITHCVDNLAVNSENMGMPVRDAAQYCVLGLQQPYENNNQE